MLTCEIAWNLQNSTKYQLALSIIPMSLDVTISKLTAQSTSFLFDRCQSILWNLQTHRACPFPLFLLYSLPLVSSVSALGSFTASYPPFVSLLYHFCYKSISILSLFPCPPFTLPLFRLFSFSITDFSRAFCVLFAHSTVICHHVSGKITWVREKEVNNTTDLSIVSVFLSSPTKHGSGRSHLMLG